MILSIKGIFIILVFSIIVGIGEYLKVNCNKSSDGKKVVEETISNFKDGVVIGKELDSINGNYSVTIKKSRWRHNKGRSWEVDKIYVTEFEYKSVSLGDTIK